MFKGLNSGEIEGKAFIFSWIPLETNILEQEFQEYKKIKISQQKCAARLVLWIHWTLSNDIF